MPLRSEPIRRHCFEPNCERAGNGNCQLRFAGAGAANQHHIALISPEGAACKLANHTRIDRCAGKIEVVDFFRQWQLRDGHLVVDGKSLLLGNL